MSQRYHAAVIEPPLVPAYRAGRAAEDPRDVILIGPTMVDQVDPGMRLGDPITHRVMGQHDPGYEHHPAIFHGAQHATVIDDLRASRWTRDRKQIGLSVGFDMSAILRRRQKSGEVWFAPPVHRSQGIRPLQNVENRFDYVRRSEIWDDGRGAFGRYLRMVESET